MCWSAPAPLLSLPGLLALSMIPTILLSPFGGILADRANRRNIMVALDTLSGLSVLIAGFATASGQDIPVIGTLLVVLSVLGAFESPTVQACIPQMLSGENIIKGNAVVNQVASIASLVTPFLGSAILYRSGNPAGILCGSGLLLCHCSFRMFYPSRIKEACPGHGNLHRDQRGLRCQYTFSAPGTAGHPETASSGGRSEPFCGRNRRGWLPISGAHRSGTVSRPLWSRRKRHGRGVHSGKSVCCGAGKENAAAPSCHRSCLLRPLSGSRAASLFCCRSGHLPVISSC